MFVLPCKQDKHGDMDGIPVVLMEAMLSGVLVITTHISGIPELVVDHETGLLCEPSNVEGLAAKIKLLITDNEIRTNICSGAIYKVKTEFDLNENVELLKNSFIKYI